MENINIIKKLVQEYHRLTNEINVIEQNIKNADESTAFALEDGIKMYTQLRFNIFQQIRNLENRTVAYTKFKYEPNKLLIFQDGIKKEKVLNSIY